jgi:hypothetical protein
LATSAQTRLSPSDPGIIDLHLAVQRLTRSIDHRAPQLVEQHPRGLVAAEPQLSLEQERRDPSLIGRHQIRGPEPNPKRQLRVMKNSPGRQGDLIPTCDTSPAPVLQHHVSSPVSTSRTAEPLRPATLRQILLAGFLGRELSMKFVQIRGKRRTGHPLTLYLVVC